jgi:hypothetical protein
MQRGLALRKIHLHTDTKSGHRAPILLPFGGSLSEMIKMLRRHSLAFTILAAALLSLQPMRVWGQETVVEVPTQEGPVVEVPTQNTTVSTGDETDAFSLPHVPLSLSLFTREGYDDNSRTSETAQGSFFTNEGITLSYNLPTHLKLRSGADLTYYPDRTGGRLNTYLDLSLAYNVSPRLKLNASVNATYREEPDFSSDVGLDTIRGNYFYTLDSLSATYDWSLRLSTVTSYSFRLVRYDNSSVGAFQDRSEETFGQELRFNLVRRTPLVGEYRFQIVDYDTAPRDSTTHFILAGIDHSFSSLLHLSVRGGATLRSYNDNGDQTSPHFEGSLTYAGAHHSSLSWTTRYGIEESNSSNAVSRTTFRTGLLLRYKIFPRVTSTAAVYYNHDEKNGSLSMPGAVTQGFSRDAFDLSVGLRYAINLRFAADLNYSRTEVSSSESVGSTTGGYSRARYSAGLTFTY